MKFRLKHFPRRIFSKIYKYIQCKANVSRAAVNFHTVKLSSFGVLPIYDNAHTHTHTYTNLIYTRGVHTEREREVRGSIR